MLQAERKSFKGGSASNDLRAAFEIARTSPEWLELRRIAAGVRPTTNGRLGVATASDLRDYFRLKPAEADHAIAGLAEDGVLVPVQVEGWSQKAWMHRDAAVPRRVQGAALLATFDPLIWERSRTERLFGFHYRIEIYVPQDRRRHGYYVLPFLMDEALVARVDLKADRQAGLLLAHRITLEPEAPAETLPRLQVELDRMAAWLGLDAVRIGAVVHRG